MGRGFRRYTSIICVITTLMSVSGVFALWRFMDPAYNGSNDFSININEFIYKPDIPTGEAMILQRIDDVLNQRYTTDNVEDSRKYLLEDTIKSEWDQGAAPYVGSMDPDLQLQLHELFGDILDNLDISFIIKNQDLNYDGLSEISLYSTSDPLDYAQDHKGVVGVYLSVFTPYVDENRNIIGYTPVCDAMYGFCNEVNYSPKYPNLPSFSTDDWRDNMVYWHHIHDTQPIPDDAIGFDGVTLYKYHYESYHSMQYYYEGYPWGYTTAWIQGNTAYQKLNGLIPQIPWW